MVANRNLKVGENGKTCDFFALPSSLRYDTHFFAYKILTFSCFEKLTIDSCSHCIELSNDMRFVGNKAI